MAELECVYQLQATGTDWMTGSTQRTIYNTFVFTSYELAKSRVEDFRRVCVEQHKLLEEGVAVDIRSLRLWAGENSLMDKTLIQTLLDVILSYPEWECDLNETACPTPTDWMKCPICGGNGSIDDRRKRPPTHKLDCKRILAIQAVDARRKFL